MISLQRIKAGQFQLFFTQADAPPVEVEKEKRRKRKIDQKAKEEAKDIIETTKETDDEQKKKLKREKIMDLLNIKGQTYHAPPSSDTISPTASQLVSCAFFSLLTFPAKNESSAWQQFVRYWILFKWNIIRSHN